MMTTKRLVLLIATLVIPGCGGDDPSGPSPEDVAGVYQAVELTYWSDDDERNLLHEGAFIDITLHADGTTEGGMYVPALEGGSPLTGDLQGTWHIDGDRIDFDHATATFIRDTPFVWGGDGVLGTRIYTADGVLDVTLSRGDVTTDL